MLEVPKRCNGCHACASICPKQCIKMVANDEGFLCPQIDKSKCINCGLCEKICPVLHKSARRKTKAKEYACYNKNLDTRMQSSSGGIFSLLAEEILSENGCVFGAAFDENWNVKHICVDNLNDLWKLRGSKYVQSEIGNSYILAKKLLGEGRKVLFTGTPCQIGGLKSFLGKEYDNLWTQDIICHGVPSPLVWQDYVKSQKLQNNAEIKSIFFRDKKDGWLEYSMKIDFENGKTYQKSFREDEFFHLFLKNLCLRNSCYDCAFKGDQNRQSDITLADFWGAQIVCGKKNFDNKGLSYVIVRTKRGQELFDKIKDNVQIVFLPMKRLVARFNNPCNLKSVKMPANRGDIFEEIRKKEEKK